MLWGVIDNSRKAVYGYDQRVEIFGSKGMIRVDNNAPDNHRYYNENGVHSSLPLNFFMDRYTEAYEREIKDFCESIAADKPVSVSGIDGLQAVAVGLAAKKSFNEKRSVKGCRCIGSQPFKSKQSLMIITLWYL